MSGPAGLDLYELAFLAGGTHRVVDTALVVLVESGRIRVHAPGELAVEEQTRRHPVEAAVMDAVGTQGHPSVETVRWRVADDARLAELGPALAAAGLVKHRPGLRRRAQKSDAWSPTASGREALERVTSQPVLDGGGALQVALHGRETMPDAALRASIFEHPDPELEPETPGERSLRRRHEMLDREVMDHDPTAAAYSTRNSHVYGFGPGGGGDGGGG